VLLELAELQPASAAATAAASAAARLVTALSFRNRRPAVPPGGCLAAWKGTGQYYSCCFTLSARVLLVP